MANARAGNKSKMVLLDNHLATGTEATYTFTPSPSLDMKATYREIIVIITGSATAALSLFMKLNADTDYDSSGIFCDTTTITTAIGAAGTAHTLLGSSVLDGANRFYCKVSIVFNDAGDYLMAQAQSSAPHEGNEITWAEDQGTSTTLDTINVYTSTSTWAIGTEISTYGIKR